MRAMTVTSRPLYGAASDSQTRALVRYVGPGAAGRLTVRRCLTVRHARASSTTGAGPRCASRAFPPPAGARPFLPRGVSDRQKTLNPSEVRELHGGAGVIAADEIGRLVSAAEHESVLLVPVRASCIAARDQAGDDIRINGARAASACIGAGPPCPLRAGMRAMAVEYHGNVSEVNGAESWQNPG